MWSTEARNRERSLPICHPSFIIIKIFQRGQAPMVVMEVKSRRPLRYRNYDDSSCSNRGSPGHQAEIDAMRRLQNHPDHIRDHRSAKRDGEEEERLFQDLWRQSKETM